MKRDIVKIDSERCTGCGLCVEACEEGAIRMLNGKAVLVREDFCDGLGKCLLECPVGAISVESREAAAFVRPGDVPMAAGPGLGGPRRIVRDDEAKPAAEAPSRLSQWPVQLRLVPANAPYFDGCDLLVAADCAAYACGSFHERFIKGRIAVIGCPKLDPAEGWAKLEDVLSSHDVRSVTVARMEVPCCNAIAMRVKEAVRKSGKDVPVFVSTIRADGGCLRWQASPRRCAAGSRRAGIPSNAEGSDAALRGPERSA